MKWLSVHGIELVSNWYRNWYQTGIECKHWLDAKMSNMFTAKVLYWAVEHTVKF